MSQDICVVIEHLRGEVADISYVMLAAARALAQGTGGSTVGVLLGHEADELAGNLAADRVLYMDDPALAEFTSDAYEEALIGVIEDNAPRAVLLGDTSIGVEVAGQLSARLGLPLISYCRELIAEDGAPKYVSQICGGKMMAEGNLPDATTLVTMIPGGYKAEEGQTTEPPEVTSVPAPALGDLRVTLKGYIEPEVGDVDITQESVLIAVGRGIQNEDNLDLAEDLAERLGGAVCASRPVVDQSWLPASRLVGKSGKTVKSKFYLAMGISGAPEHVEGITDSDTIVAINMDPDAPIFDVAQYGIEADMFDVVPVLLERLQK